MFVIQLLRQQINGANVPDCFNRNQKLQHEWYNILYPCLEINLQRRWENVAFLMLIQKVFRTNTNGPRNPTLFALQFEKCSKYLKFYTRVLHFLLLFSLVCQCSKSIEYKVLWKCYNYTMHGCTRAWLSCRAKMAGKFSLRKFIAYCEFKSVSALGFIENFYLNTDFSRNCTLMAPLCFRLLKYIEKFGCLDTVSKEQQQTTYVILHEKANWAGLHSLAF